MTLYYVRSIIEEQRTKERGEKMKGYKAFGKGMICKGKQYAENTVFGEDTFYQLKNGEFVEANE